MTPDTLFTLLDGPCHSHEVYAHPWDTHFVAITQSDYFSYQRGPDTPTLMYYQGRLIDLKDIRSRWPIHLYARYYDLLKEGGFTAHIWYSTGEPFFTILFAKGAEAVMFYRGVWGL